MIKRKEIRFIATHDEGFGEPVIGDTVLLASDMTAEFKGYEMLTFRVMPKALEETDFVLDMAKCKLFRVEIEGDLTDEELDFMSEAKFIDVIRRFAK